MLISTNLETLQMDLRLHKELLQDGQDRLSNEFFSRVFFAFLMDHFLLTLPYLHIFFVCNETEHQIYLSSVSEKKTFEKENLNL